MEQNNTEQTPAENTQAPAETTATQENSNTNLLGETAEQQTEQQVNPDRPEWLPEKFKSPEDFAKSYTELEKKLSSVPKAPEEYDFTFTKDIGLNDMSEEQNTEVQKMFKNLNLTQEQAKGVMGMYNDAMRDYQAQVEEQAGPKTDISVEQARLKKMWGTEYDSNLQAVREVSNKLGKSVIYQPLTDTAEGMQLLFDYYNSNKEINPIAATGSANPTQDIRAKIAEMRADSKYRLPQGDALGDSHRAEIYRLYQLIERGQK